MRFFEIPVSGGLQVASACPDWGGEFVDNESIISFGDQTELVHKLRTVLDNKQHAQFIRKNAWALVRQRHTYVDRLKKILNLLN
jgi:spore maturation protein CgeB